jgi:hypothetical protein
MIDVYILELVFKDENGQYQYRYFKHDKYFLKEYPTHRCLMELTPAKAKRTKILKDFKNGDFKGLVDIRIRPVTLNIGAEVEKDWPKSILTGGYK